MDFSSEAKSSHHHDTHALPPIPIQEAYLHYNKVKRQELEQDDDILYFGRELSEKQRDIWRPAGTISASVIENACNDYWKAALTTDDSPCLTDFQDATIYEHKDIPGLQIVPGILPMETQILFTSQLMHRDLADPKHKINLEADYHIPYPPPRPPPQDDLPASSSTSTPSHSFFTLPQSSPNHALHPKPPAAASSPTRTNKKPLNMAQFLASKLRWLTLGEQYDWPTRSYGITRTPFPPDLSVLVTGLFPHIRPESGVVLVYSGKDYMPVHRDVSEHCERALASFSVGCEGVFVIQKGDGDGDGNDEGERGSGGDGEEDHGGHRERNGGDEREDRKHEQQQQQQQQQQVVPRRRPDRTAAIRVRSGDCVLLSGEARWAWHAMPRTIPGTCPEPLAQWPVGTPGASEEERRAYGKWKGYMGTKRINVSCRQVWD
ncbi:oxidoreductase domain containing protein [Diplodia corticola]|uniref:Oxidoreductase domain containing protein n=1 Tax=Diplodia corticola TaxID=236234 RepID=A0A1J9SKV1_9PEZI|nr:oxidoreductase domain containing protein [Diplodia corticola]OJD40237.1 oxidoreductase domain containing protein [Diplodia corticola]